jgi:hypothetical protein
MRRRRGRRQKIGAEVKRRAYTLYPASPKTAASYILADHSGLEVTLAAALSIERDKNLQDRFRTLAGTRSGASFQISQAGSNCWLRLGHGSTVTIHRGRAPQLAAIDFEQALAADRELAKNLHESITRIRRSSAVAELIQPLTGNATPSRESVARLLPWAPLLERLSYKYSVRVVGYLNAIRPDILHGIHNGGTSPEFVNYRIAAQIVGRAILFASEPGANSWLVDMSKHMTWGPWTPTFALIRERSAWLACCAARSAVAFGPSVVDNYFGVLAGATHPINVFDALFGLVAISIGHANVKRTVIAELERMRLQIPRGIFGNYIDAAYSEALRILKAGRRRREEDLATFQPDWTRSNGIWSLADLSAIHVDPIEMSANGTFFGFALIPMAVAADQMDFYPLMKRNWHNCETHSVDLGERFFNAWEPARNILRTLN